MTPHLLLGMGLREIIRLPLGIIRQDMIGQADLLNTIETIGKDMDKKTQDLAWRCLPKEARLSIVQLYVEFQAESKGDYANRPFWVGIIRKFESIYGEHNLTSDTEPEELLMVERKKVQEKWQRAYEQESNYAKAQDSPTTRIEMYYCRGIMSIIDSLFGDKCLPDEEGDTNAPKPKFKVGDKVRKTSWDKDTTISMVEWHGTWKTFVYHFKEQEYGFNCHKENDLILVSKRAKDPDFSIGDKVQLKFDWCGSLKGTLLTIKDIPTIDRDDTFMYSFEETDEYLRETMLEPYIEPKPKFKIGDKVYQTSGTNRLEEYTIKKVYADKRRGIVYDIQGLIGIIGIEEHNLCLTCQNPYTKAETKTFSIGDKVRVIDIEEYAGEVTEIIAVDKSDPIAPYKLDLLDQEGGGIWCGGNAIEPYTEPETTRKNTQDLSLSDKQNTDNMEEKELNLAELLKGCEGEKIYSLLDGDVEVYKVCPKEPDNPDFAPYIGAGIDLVHAYHPNGTSTACEMDGKNCICLLYPSRALYEKYPLDAKKAWDEWASERKPKRWRAEEGKEYWYLSAFVIPEITSDDLLNGDDKLYECGNYFRTKIEAQQAAEAVRETLMKIHEQNQK